MIELTGYHYHNLDQNNQSRRFVNNTLIKNLKTDRPAAGWSRWPDDQRPFGRFENQSPWVVEGKPLRDR